MTKQNQCKWCAFAFDKKRGFPRGSYPCLCCCDNSFTPNALKDFPSYFYLGEIPQGMWPGDFARQVRHYKKRGE